MYTPAFAVAVASVQVSEATPFQLRVAAAVVTRTAADWVSIRPAGGPARDSGGTPRLVKAWTLAGLCLRACRLAACGLGCLLLLKLLFYFP